MANIFRTISAKFYQNRPGFVDNVTKTFGVFFEYAVPIAVHLQNANDEFHKVVYRHYSGEVETLKLLYRKFIQDNVYQILSECTVFCGRYDENILVCFSVHSVLAKAC